MSYYYIEWLGLKRLDNQEGCYEVSIRVNTPDGESINYVDIYVSVDGAGQYSVDTSRHNMDAYQWVDDGYGNGFPSILEDDIVAGVKEAIQRLREKDEASRGG